MIRAHVEVGRSIKSVVAGEEVRFGDHSMSVKNGEWIMHGLDESDPACIHSVEELIIQRQYLTCLEFRMDMICRIKRRT